MGESASPFIDKGDVLTSERERVRMLLILIAHAGGYRMMVMSDACGRLRRLLLVWQTSVPAILLMPRGMQGVLPCLSSMGVYGCPQHCRADVGAHNTT